MQSENKKNNPEKRVSRRKFLKNTSLLTGGVGVLTTGIANAGFAGGESSGTNWSQIDPVGIDTNEVLYNGIQLPAIWPPREMKPDDYEPMPVPYLKSPPVVIPIDVGRQLFLDDFLIEKTDLKRQFHQPIKYENNPVLQPQSKVEMNEGYCPMAAPFSDGVFYDPQDKLFKLWYMAGWFDGTALATSSDGIHWQRPKLDVVPGTNLVLAPRNDLRRDGASIWLDHDTANPAERYKMYWWARKGKIGSAMSEDGGYLLTSGDGVHWKWHGKIGNSGDNSTLFYNPFRKVWAFTVRRFGRALPPWSDDPWRGAQRPRGRARSYWENKDLMAALGKWQGYDPVFWLGADKLDHKRDNYAIGSEPQLYKVDAVGYESLMIGLLQRHYGPSNGQCAKGGFPKLTELQLAFSRDGFHWDRSCRETFVGATLQKDSWERGYIHSVGGVCNIVGDKLHFYYTAFQGDESKKNRMEHWNGMYAKGSTGLAVLRRDGFASMEAGGEEKILFTRPLQFTGKYLFVNIDAPKGKMYVVVCYEDGTPIPGFSREQCIPVSTDSTKYRVVWKNNDDLQVLAGKPVRFKFYLTNAKIYAFWVSKSIKGESGGATAAGGPGLIGTWDT